MRKKVSIIMIATLLFGLLNPIFSDSIVEASENVRLDVTHNLEYRNGNTSSTGLNNGLQIGRGSETALKFDLSTVDVNRIKDVELRVYVSGSALPPGGSSFINVWGTDDDNWDEGSASIPDKEQLLVERDNIGSLGDVLFQGESDLTNFIKRSAQENEFVTFVFSGHNDLSLHISHRDRGDRAPYLKITYYEPPTDISLTNHEIEEFQPSGTVVGSLSADADDDQISYSLQSGDVSDFIIEGNELRTASEFDYEDQSTYDLTIRAMDSSGQYYDKNFQIDVNYTRSADLENLELSEGTLNPDFDTNTLSYTAHVENEMDSVQVIPTLRDTTSSLEVNGRSVISGEASEGLPLEVGENAITIEVTAQNGDEKTYTLTVDRAPSSNADLSNLQISEGELDPEFDAETTNYEVSVGNNTETLAITPTVDDETAIVSVNGSEFPSGEASENLPLEVGENAITVEVTAQNGDEKTYTLTVDRAPSSNADLSNLQISEGELDPDFDTATSDYEVSVGNNTETLAITPTVDDETATVSVNGSEVPSGEASESMALEVGENPITIEVTAQNGDEKTYTLTVDRAPSSNADLSNLQISEGELDPDFDTATTDYEVSVGNNTETLAITPIVDDETATVSVNGSGIPSGEASESLALEVGENLITVEVTAQNGDEKTYTLTVDRAPSSNADLSNLQISEGELDPDFDTATSDYEVSVGNNTETLAITPIVDDETATVSVNGSGIPSGEASESLALEVGENLITVEVTAQNGDEKTYTLTVDRAPSSNADLSNLQISEGELDPDFDTATTDYEVSVGNNTETLAITPTVEDETAIVSVNGSEIPSGEASENLPLEVGKNPITVEVTAQNGDKKTYTLTVDRASSSNADLSYLDVSEGTLQPDFQKDMKEYNMLVNYDVDYLQVTAFTDSDDAELKINGQTALSGEGTDRISLEAGAVNEVDITVIAEDLTIQNYQINVTRLLQRSVAAIEIDGQTATVSDRDIMIIEENGILSIELPEEINHLQLSEDQIEYLIAQNINIEIMKPGIKMSLPSSNFNTALAVEISIEKIESSDSIDDIELSAGTVYQFSIDHGGQILDQFDYGVELAFDISDEETNPELLNVYYWNDELRDWEYVDGEYNDGKILATTEHFSTFGVFNSSVFQEVDEGQEVEEDKDKESTLPRTASSTYNWLAIGALLMLAGLCMILYRRYKIMK